MVVVCPPFSRYDLSDSDFAGAWFGLLLASPALLWWPGLLVSLSLIDRDLPNSVNGLGFPFFACIFSQSTECAKE